MKVKEFLKLSGISLCTVNMQEYAVLEREEHTLKSFDEFSSDIDGNQLVVYYSRNIVFEPAEIFSIKVTYRVVWEIMDEQMNTVKNELAKLTEEDIDFLINRAAGEASLVISQLAKAAEFAPVVTPPFYIS